MVVSRIWKNHSKVFTRELFQDYNGRSSNRQTFMSHSLNEVTERNSSPKDIVQNTSEDYFPKRTSKILQGYDSYLSENPVLYEQFPPGCNQQWYVQGDHFISQKCSVGSIFKGSSEENEFLKSITQTVCHIGFHFTALLQMNCILQELQVPWLKKMTVYRRRTL
jgi:hypothetical protein